MAAQACDSDVSDTARVSLSELHFTSLLKYHTSSTATSFATPSHTLGRKDGDGTQIEATQPAQTGESQCREAEDVSEVATCDINGCDLGR